MQDLKGSKTYDNLLIAYAGESQARNKYEFFAAKAQEEGYRQIAELFRETASNEKEHAEIWYKHFVGIGTTPENLMTAAEGEHYEWSEMYDDMACVAREEGFDHIAYLFEHVGAIEKEHEERYRKLAESIQNGTVFARQTEQVWICTNCGHIHVGTHAPEKCPVCDHPQGYFVLRAQNY